MPDQPQQPDPFEILGLDPEPVAPAGAARTPAGAAPAGGPPPSDPGPPAGAPADDDGWDDGDFV